MTRESEELFARTLKIDMSEAELENYLVSRVNKVGGIAYKFVSPGNRGVPDRLVLFPGGIVCFVELKDPFWGVVSASQKVQHRRISKVGCRCLIITTTEEVDEFIRTFHAL